MNQSPKWSRGPIPIALTINGTATTVSVEPRTTLLDLLREHLLLTGTKKGCDHGQCGACTVLIDDKRMVSCLAIAAAHEGASVTTIEGLADDTTDSIDGLHPLQQAFLTYDAFQCGYCTPGQICSAQGLLNEGHAHTRDEIREAMSGNLCRCGAYPHITDAILAVLSQQSAQ